MNEAKDSVVTVEKFCVLGPIVFVTTIGLASFTAALTQTSYNGIISSNIALTAGMSLTVSLVILMSFCVLNHWLRNSKEYWKRLFDRLPAKVKRLLSRLKGPTSLPESRRLTAITLRSAIALVLAYPTVIAAVAGVGMNNQIGILDLTDAEKKQCVYFGLLLKTEQKQNSDANQNTVAGTWSNGVLTGLKTIYPPAILARFDETVLQCLQMSYQKLKNSR